MKHSQTIAQPEDMAPVDSYVIDTLGAPFKVTLKNCVCISIDKTSGRKRVTVPDPIGLLLAVVRRRAMDQRKLSGPEIKFFRQALGVQANKLARFLDVTPEHFSRCEAGDRVLSATAEKQLRLFAYSATLFPNPEDILEPMPEPPKPIDDKAKKLARDFLNIFLRMKIEAVRNANDAIEYVFIRRPIIESCGASNDADGDWQPTADAA